METEIGKPNHFCSTSGEVRHLREAGTLPPELRLDPGTRRRGQAGAPLGLLLVRLNLPHLATVRSSQQFKESLLV